MCCLLPVMDSASMVKERWPTGCAWEKKNLEMFCKPALWFGNYKVAQCLNREVPTKFGWI